MTKQPHLAFAQSSLWGAIAGVSLMTALSAGCVIDHGHSPPLGTVTFRWSLEERFDRADCYARGAATMRVFVYDRHGTALEQTNSSCSAFGTTTALNEDWYSATMQLLDVNAAPVSTALDTGPFYVLAGTDELVDTDFPADSFY